MNKYFFCLTFLTLASCISIKGDFKGLYSYYDKTNRDFPGLIIYPTPEIPLCNITKTETPKVVLCNGKQLKTCMERSGDAVLFIWDPKCKGARCYPIEVVQRACRVKQVQLFVVSEYFDGNTMKLDYDIDRPIFGIDTKYYNTSLTDRYVAKFIWDLTNTEDRYIKFILFKNGQYERKFMRIEDL